MRESALDPPVIKDEFWNRPDVCQALAQREIGALFRLLRQYEGLSQIKIGTAVELAQVRVSRISRDLEDVTTRHVLTRIANGLSMPNHARLRLGIAPREADQQPADHPARISRVDQGDELLRRISSARYLDTSVIELLQEETNAIRLLDRRLGAPMVAAKLEAHIDQLKDSLHHSLTPRQRERLALVLADAAALAGWQAIDTDRLVVAWNHFETAAAAAREAGNRSLLAFAAGEQAYVLLDLGQPADALEKVHTVHDQAGSTIPHLLRGWLYAAEAEMAAADGQETVCRATLDRAASEIDRPVTAGDLPYLALDSGHLARWRGNCLIHFGDNAIIADLSTALGSMDGSFTRAEAGLRCDLASALHAIGEHTEARNNLGRAAELAQISGSARQRRRITELRRRIGRAA